MKRTGIAASCLLAAALLVACGGEPPVRTKNVELVGEIRLPPGIVFNGKVYVSLFQSWALQGALRHPLQPIGTFTTAPGRYAHRFDYPEDGGEGLVVYAWADLDGDGVLCTPSYRLDPAGLVEVDGFPADRVAADVVLTEPCRGPDWFYPPAAGG